MKQSRQPPRAQPLLFLIFSQFIIYLFLNIVFPFLYCQDKTGDRFSGETGEAALPDARKVARVRTRRNNLRIGIRIRISDLGNGQGSVEVLPDLSNYPIRDSPGVDPNDGARGVAALGDNGAAEGYD